MLVLLSGAPAVVAQPSRDAAGFDPTVRPPAVLRDPPASGPVVLSGGVPTQGELAVFESVWMNEPARTSAVTGACDMAYSRFLSGVWGTYDYMVAMARMYTITRHPMYVEQLDKIATCILNYRDDRHPGPRPGTSLAEARYLRRRPLDQIRNRQALPAWGARSLDAANLHYVGEVVSSLYAYSLALTARVVLEDAALRPTYGGRAVAYANAAIETIGLFLAQFETRSEGAYNRGFLVVHSNVRNRWTKADCGRAFAETIAAQSPPASPETVEWYGKQRTNCERAIELDVAGRPLSNNENNAFAMAMIELVRALNAPAYRQHAKALPGADLWRTSYPLFVSRIQRYFRSDLRRDGSGSEQRYLWHHSELTDRWEDASHAGLSMQYVVALARDFGTLDPIARRAEPILFEPNDLRLFATTFVRMNGGRDMATDVRSASPTSSENNSLCFAWLDLSVADRRVYDICRERTLRIENGRQPNLTIGNHAALLANGRAQ